MAKVFLDTGDNYRIVNDDTEVFGAFGDDDSIIIEAGAEGISVNANVDRIDFAGSIADFTFVQTFGANMEVWSADGSTLIASIPVQTDVDGTQLVFADGSVAAIYDEVANTMGVGGEDLVADPEAPAAITPDAAAIDDTVTTEAELEDEPVIPSFSIDGPDVEEGETATFTITLSEPVAEETTVDYEISLVGGATADDHGDITVDGAVDNSLTGTLTFAAGQTSKTIEIPITEDTISPEEGEGINVALSNPTGGDVVLSDNAGDTITIIDVPLSFELTQGADDVQEGDTITYTLTATAPVEADTDVSFVVVPGDPTAPNQGTNNTNLNDFSQGAFNPSTVTMAAGTTTVQFTLETVDDGITELPEDFLVEAEIDGEVVDTITTTLLDGAAGAESFTLTATDAVVTDTASTGVSPEGSTFSENDQTVDALNKLHDDTILQDPSTTDDDLLKATIGNATPAPLVSNIERFEITSTNDGAELDYGSISGNNAVQVAGSKDFGLTSFVQDGSILVTLTSASDVTITTAALAADDDEFDLAVNGATGSITLADALGGAAADVIVNLASEGTATNELELDAAPADIVVSELNITGSADLELAANPNTGAAIDLSAQVVDASGHDGVLSLLTDSIIAIDAENWDGVDNLVLTGTYNDTISNLAADVTVVSTSGDTLIVIANQTGVTEQDVVLGSATDAALTVTTLTANSVETLNIATDDAEMDGTDRLHKITTLNGTSLQTLNVTAAEEAPFETAYTTRAGEAGDRDFALNLDGAGDITFDLAINAGIDTAAIDVSGTGTRTFSELDINDNGDMAPGGLVTFTGDSNVTVTTLNFVTATVGYTVNLNSDADITIDALGGTPAIADGQTMTINSQSSDGTGTNEITDPSALAFGNSSILEITGNQKLIIGEAGNEVDMHNTGNTQIIDASEFTGEFELFIARDATAGENNAQTINVGSGDTTVNIDAESTALANDDVFTFVFDQDGIGDVEIVNFSTNGLSQGEDVLDFSAFADTGAVVASYTAGTGVLAYDDGTEVTFEVDDSGNDDVLVGTSEEFGGSVTITITGVDLTLGDLAATNFA